MLINTVTPSYLGWTPGANTYIYYPLTSDLVDVMGNGNTGTMNGTCTFDSNTGIHVTGKSNNYVTGMTNGINNRNTFTLNVWTKFDDISQGAQLLGYSSNLTTNNSMTLGSWSDSIRQSGYGIYSNINCGNTSLAASIDSDTNWHNWCIVGTGSEYRFYCDGILKSQTSLSTNVNNYPEMQLGWGGLYTSSRSGNGYIKDYIVETVARTAQEVADYYNQTKSTYGL